MAPHTPNPNPNALVRQLRKVYNPAGFSKGYNFALFFILAGALFGFALARLSYLDITNTYYTSTAPGEAYWPRNFSHYRIGITLHLACIIPAAVLVVWQFLPVIRHRALILHRVNGYAVSLLLLVSNVGALMIARRAFGGGLETQGFVGVLAIMTTTGTVLAWVNIKRLQIDQHRAWMLRTWIYAGCIVTVRLIMVLATLVVSRVGSYWVAMPCEVVADVAGTREGYAGCENGGSGMAAVHADFEGKIEEIAASLQITFGMACWMALALHAVGVEVYLAFTPVEGERLRRVSYERQLERGFEDPGSAGLTVERFGDAEAWKPKK
ncbi:hypothetical protein MBLNU230_g2310t1 [Neophaeotheca triangularis]